MKVKRFLCLDEKMESNFKAKTLRIFQVMAGVLFLLSFFFLVPEALKDILLRKRSRAVHAEIDQVQAEFMAEEEDVIRVLKMINDPEFDRNIYELGIVKSIAVDSEKNVVIVLGVYPGCPYKIELYLAVKNAVSRIRSVKSVRVKIEPVASLPYLKDKKEE